jgi:pyridoxine 4-dehydrogenase
MANEPTPFEVDASGRWFHGTKADLRVGDLLEPGRRSNYGEGRTANHVYFSATLDAATWGAELAVGDGRGRIYVVEPLGALEDDPNVTDKKFPGNPTRSYRTRDPRADRRRTTGLGGALAREAQGNARAPRRTQAHGHREDRRLTRVDMNTTSFIGDKPVHRIGLGAMQLAGPGVFGPPRDPGAASAVLRRALELGVDHIDTAQYYGPDVVNDLIRETLHPYPENLKLVTKVGARRDPQGGWLPAQSPAELRAGVEDNLRSLQVERMDLVNLRLIGHEASSELLAEQLGTLEDLRGEGKLDLIGISEVGVDVVHRALELVDIAEVQNSYSVVNRSGEDVLELCMEREIAFVPYFPLGSAFTGGPQQLAQDPVIAGVANRRGITATQVALAWLLSRYERMLLIPGTSSVEHLEQNMAAADVELDELDIAELEDATQLGDPVPERH